MLKLYTSDIAIRRVRAKEDEFQSRPHILRRGLLQSQDRLGLPFSEDLGFLSRLLELPNLASVNYGHRLSIIDAKAFLISIQ